MMSPIYIICVGVLFLMGCTKGKEASSMRSVYYWRTTFVVSNEAKEWMKKEGVGRMYVRLFDVVETDNDEGCKPVGTITFKDSVPRGVEVIPVVYVRNEVIGSLKDITMLCDKLMKRIDDVTRQNGVGVCSEIQIDCDWTRSTHDKYFELLKMMSDRLHSEGRTISTTIRLHQLDQDAPPVDRGVLMLYNTGNFRDWDEENSILSEKGVEPYLNRFKDYDLPLSLALPDFGWNVVFRDGKFAQIVQNANLTDTTLYRAMDMKNHYIVLSYHNPGGNAGVTGEESTLYPFDRIRREESSDSLNQVMYDRIRDIRSDVVDEVIMYHLHDNPKQVFPR